MFDVGNVANRLDRHGLICFVLAVSHYTGCSLIVSLSCSAAKDQHRSGLSTMHMMRINNACVLKPC